MGDEEMASLQDEIQGTGAKKKCWVGGWVGLADFVMLCQTFCFHSFSSFLWRYSRNIIICTL